MTIPSKIEIETPCRRFTVEVGAPPLKEEDAEGYEEDEFELLNVADTHTHPNVVLNYISPAKVKVEYTPGAIRIGMRDLIGEQQSQPMDIDIDQEQLYCIVLYLQPVLNPKSYDGARVLEASGRPMLVIGRSY